jgi:microcin C transport system substrate-binding protein
VFRAGRYWVPQWYANTHRLAYWDVFSHPAALPRYNGVGVPDLWWSDAAKIAKNPQTK